MGKLGALGIVKIFESVIKIKLRPKFSKIPVDIDLANELITDRRRDAINKGDKLFLCEIQS
jgi:hypothetical protein